ncbi:MAG: histidinol-phosphatase [Bacteroidetes bacterium]|nr:histidinol-phosphatase [Bacteroidota bacterium]
MHYKRLSFFLILYLIVGFAVGQSRKDINIPDISGYKTLKCDFHMHTVFSDGTVWPTVRIKEAWLEGLDAISITDHIEYLQHSKDISADHNRSFEIARPLAMELDVILVKGAEITRDMPPGHLNALFITNANLLVRDDVMDALNEARDQGAFIMWNHPGWKAQQPDTTLWWEKHTELFNNDLMHGIEVYNSRSYFPEALDWANEKGLTMFGNTDVHGPMESTDSHRTMTLVFAKNRSVGGIKEALFSRRTVAYFGNTLIGESKYLEPLFFESLDYDKTLLRLKDKESRTIQIKNNSDIDYELELLQPGVGFEAPEVITLKAHQVTLLQVSGNSDEVNTMKKLDLFYEVKNMKISSKDNLVVTFSFKNN